MFWWTTNCFHIQLLPYTILLLITFLSLREHSNILHLLCGISNMFSVRLVGACIPYKGLKFGQFDRIGQFPAPTLSNWLNKQPQNASFSNMFSLKPFGPIVRHTAHRMNTAVNTRCTLLLPLIKQNNATHIVSVKCVMCQPLHTFV